MSTKGAKTFVGFGFGPIQSGLFLFEAYRSKNFGRFLIAEIDEDLVHAVRSNNGCCRINVAHKDGIRTFELEGIEIHNPCYESDRKTIIDAVAESEEICTALPSIDFYDGANETSAASMISLGLSSRSAAIPTIVYTAENHNQAAEILFEAISSNVPPRTLQDVQVVNTVIGKMSGVIVDSDTIQRIGLETVTPHLPRAVLVEEFNTILISRINLNNHQRGIAVFVEKDDLLPFEEAKLYGHNAVHALIAYLADLKGMETIAEAGQDPDIMKIAHQAFVHESGAALLRLHQNLSDPLFTPEGYREYAEDLLERMMNPHLHDLVSRVARDPVRKLGYDDRLFGTMRLALQYNVEPRCLALGAAAAILSMMKRRESLHGPFPTLPEDSSCISDETVTQLLREIWGSRQDEYAQELIGLTCRALQTIQRRGEEEMGTQAVVAGHICLDIIPTIESQQIHFSPGQLVEVGAACVATGGPVSNTGLALHKLGIKTQLMGKIGNDLFGRAIREVIAGHDSTLVEGIIEVPDEVSSYTIILSSRGADRMFLHCPACNDTFVADDVKYDLVKDSQLFHFGYPPLMKRMIENDGVELKDLFRRAKATGVTTSLDMTLPDPGSFSGTVNWPVILSGALRHVDIFLPSLEEVLCTLYPEIYAKHSDQLSSFVRPELVSSIGDDLLSMGPKIVGLKLGEMGLYLRTADHPDWESMGRATPSERVSWTGRQLWSPCFKAQVAGTTGAGDATIAGFLAGFLRGLKPEKTITMACAVGACNVEAADALGGIRSWSETKKRSASGWPRVPLAFPMAGWHCASETGLFYGPNDATIPKRQKGG